MGYRITPLTGVYSLHKLGKAGSGQEELLVASRMGNLLGYEQRAKTVNTFEVHVSQIVAFENCVEPLKPSFHDCSYSTIVM